MTACIFRLSDASSGSPGKETGSSQPESAAVTAGEGPSASRSEKRWSRVSWTPTGATTHQTAAAERRASASAHSSNSCSGCQSGGAAETQRDEAGSRGGDSGRQRAGETRGGTVSMFLISYSLLRVHWLFKITCLDCVLAYLLLMSSVVECN